MKNTLDTLQDVLLVFTIIVLVYVLYKRLLIVLGKKEKNKKYPTIGEKVIWSDDHNASLEVNLFEKTNLSVSIFSADGQEVKKISEGEFEPGRHIIDVKCAGLPSGKYYFKIVNPFMESSQYFTMQ